MLCKAAQGVLSNIKKPEYLPRYDYFKCPHLKTRGPEEQTLQGLHHWRGNFNLEFKGWALTTSAHRRLPGQNVLLHTRERKHQGKESCVKKQLGDKQRLKEILKSGKRKTPEPTRSPWGAHTTLTGRTESRGLRDSRHRGGHKPREAAWGTPHTPRAAAVLTDEALHGPGHREHDESRACTLDAGEEQNGRGGSGGAAGACG